MLSLLAVYSDDQEMPKCNRRWAQSTSDSVPANPQPYEFTRISARKCPQYIKHE